MENKKYQVFVSSTYKDLINEREKIIETILSLYHFPVGMEMFSADDSEQWEIIQETINVSDYYVIIIGHRYGSISSDGVSYTEKEYDYAKEKGIPILAFIKDRNAATLPEERESDSVLAAKLDSFVEKATKSKMCDFWGNIDELATKVAIALPKVFSRKPQIGWVRGSEAVSKEISQELAELSTENRDLRNKIRELESLALNGLPEIQLEIESKSYVKITCSRLEPENKVSLPNKISKLDFPKRLEKYISEDEIRKYNESLPTKEELENYNLLNKFYYLINNESINPTLTVSNTGSTKANDVYLTIKFPNIVKVIEKSKGDQFKKPKNPIPESPLSKAERKYIESRLSALENIIRTNRVLSDTLSPHHSILSDIAPLSRQPILYWCSVSDNNIVTLQLENLIHTRNRSFEDEVLIVPVKCGQGEIEVSIICEEFKEEKTINIPLEVLVQ